MATVIVKGLEVLIDDEDLALLNGRPIHLHDNGYGRLSARVGKDHLQRLLLNPPSHLTVDHRNGNPLDNRRHNLRLATRRQQQFNRQAPRKKDPNGFRGVQLTPSGNYSVRIRVDGQRLYVGKASDPIEAARMYDEAAKKLHGEFAILNFPEKAT